jgi:hypothetical protein
MTEVIRICSPDWGDCVSDLAQNPRTMVYAAPFFGSFLKAALELGEVGCFLCRDGDECLGILPYHAVENERFGRVVNSLSWYGSHGGCMLKDPARGDVRDALLSAYQETFLQDESSLFSSTVILTHEEEACCSKYIHRLNGVAGDWRIGQMTPLPMPGEDLGDRLLAQIHQKTRNLVRKSLKQGFKVVAADTDYGWDFLYATHVENMEGIGGKAKPRHHFNALRTEIPVDHRRLILAMDGDEPVAALFLILFNKTVEYVTPVIKLEHRSRQPLSLLIYQGMVDAVVAGFRWWNWGGTWESQESLYHFKSRWGAEDLRYSYIINLPEKSRAMAATDLARLQEEFPFMYLLPYSLLDMG